MLTWFTKSDGATEYDELTHTYVFGGLLAAGTHRLKQNTLLDHMRRCWLSLSLHV